MKYNKVMFCLMFFVSTLQMSSISGLEVDPSVKVAVSISDLFGINGFTKKMTELLEQKKLLESNLNNFNISQFLGMSNSTGNSSGLLHVILQKYVELSEKNRYLEARLTEGGVTYTRWGRKFCNATDTETVYSGYVGGSHYTQSGGSVDYVCLPSDGLSFSSLESYDYSYMYGAEYELNGPLKDNDVPCAVCRSTKYTTTLMVPARNQCYDKWKVIYNGNLTSGRHSHAAASSYLCLDSDAETLDGGGNVNGDGKLLYPVKAQCGSLKCPPYIHDATLTCVVCGK